MMKRPSQPSFPIFAASIGYFDCVIRNLNSTPRKCLGYRTPIEAFAVGRSASVSVSLAFSFVVSLSLLVSSSSAVSGARNIGIASVVDGDTIEIHGIRIRLHGIDAPESAQQCSLSTGELWRCGQQAALALSDRIGGRSLMCDERGQDRYGRSIAVCMLGSENLNYWMVEQGWAVA